MNKKDAEKRIAKLRKEIDYHRYHYHVLDKQEISDAALDSLKHELFLLEQEYPELITPDSPTQRVAGKALDKFKKVQHRHRMLSLQDVFSVEELQEWEDRIKKIIPKQTFEYFVELKIDGLAISLWYENGLLQYGATRGDGFWGEDVTYNLKTIGSIPLCIPFKEPIEIRGEVYMTKDVFEKVNQEREKSGESLYANPRNLAAGSIRQLDPMVAAQRKLSFYAYDAREQFFDTHSNLHKKLKEFGFKLDNHSKICKSIKEVFNFCSSWVDKRNNMPYQVDGVVVAVNNQQLHEQLGVVGKAPRWAVAYKFPAEQATTIIEDIQVQVGRTGAITPVAHLQPVTVAGSVVSRATLHNYDEVKRLDVRVGDTVVIEKAGDIIPDIIKVLPHLRSKDAKPWHMPKQCPLCNSPITQKEGEVAYYCTNKSCFGLQREQLAHFISKKAFNIEGVGPRSIEQLIESGLVNNVIDLFELQKGDLLELEGFAEKSVDNLLTEIERRKNIKAHKFLYALGIRYVGQETAQLLTNFLYTQQSTIHTPLDILAIMTHINTYELQAVDGIGQKVSQSIVDYFGNESTQQIFSKMTELGIHFEMLQGISQNLREDFEGKKFIMTGTFSDMTRDEVYELIKYYGGEITQSVTKKTNYVLVGDKPGSKVEQAKKLGIALLSEKDFKKMIA